MKKTERTKQLILEQLQKTPIIEAACQKLEISRMTFYRWKNKDEEFAKKVDEAIFDGCLLVNDLAENQLISAVKGQNMQGIMYWLKHHHGTYKTRVEINANINQITEKLTPEQEGIVREALRLAALSGSDVNYQNKNESSTTGSETDPTDS